MSAQEDLLSQCQNYDFVRFTFADIHGIGRCKSVPKRHLAKYIKTGPLVWEGTIMMGPKSQIAHNIPCGTNNIAITPQPGTFHSLPWATSGKYKVGEFLCEPHWLYKSGQQGASTRSIARKQVEKLTDLGYNVYSGYEMEFILCDPKTEKPLRKTTDFATTQGLARFEEFVYTLDEQLIASNVNVETNQTEYAAGQIEMATEPRYGMASPDQAFNFKQACREVARQHNMLATFMTIPFPGVGNGLHFSHSIWTKDGQNAMYDESKDDNISDFGKHWLAGIMKHSVALAFMCAPTINCWRRFHNPWAPGILNWDIDDRFVAVRVKNQGVDGTYIENRYGGGSANPYLIFAATIAAGLDGVQHKLECPPRRTVDPANEKLPSTWQQGRDAFKKDRVMVEALGEEFVEWFLSEKDQIEAAALKDVDISVCKDEDFEKERDMYLETL